MSSSELVALLCSPSSEDCDKLCSALEELRVQVLQAFDPADVSDLSSQDCFVLIIVDLDSDSDWRSTVRSLQRTAPSAGVVVYSRLPDEHLWIDALETGAFDFICKPFDRRELHWILENALRMRLDRQPATREVMGAVAKAACRGA